MHVFVPRLSAPDPAPLWQMNSSLEPLLNRRTPFKPRHQTAKKEGIRRKLFRNTSSQLPTNLNTIKIRPKFYDSASTTPADCSYISRKSLNCLQQNASPLLVPQRKRQREDTNSPKPICKRFYLFGGKFTSHN